MVTLFKGGTNQTTVPINEVYIPDLWHIAQAIRIGAPILDPETACEMILMTWCTAAWLKGHILTHEGG
jgi:hypothetical protein